ncbi:M20/M25/M40 family metallo-hydrolase [bacterium]|nr:M20/M25/M40 family metallo-hydrolase [bacterium]
MPEFDEGAVKKEVTGLLSQLIRIDTSNPPGNETAAAEFLRDLLVAEGLQAEIVESAPGRGSLLARVPGKGKRKSLLLMSHLDVVPASAEGWKHPPFAGIVEDGFVWGRGAWDCKGMVAPEVVALLLLLREGFQPQGDLVLALWADEEKGGNMGAGWVVKNRPELVQADFVVNEGGGHALPVDGRNHYTIQVAEKGVFWTRLTTRGTPGHASMPHKDNALLKMSTCLSRLGTLKTPIQQSEIVGQYLSKRLASIGQMPAGKLQVDDRFLEELEKTHPRVAAEVNTLVRMSIAPTMIQAGTKENIIPERCQAVVDCRLLPGQTAEDLRRTFADALGSLEEVEIEPIQADEGSISPLDTELYEAIIQTMSELDPGCGFVPYMVSGGTDSRFFRQKGVPAYGFFPLKPDIPLSEQLSIVHGRNERISQENLLLATKFFYELVKKMLG